MVNVFGLKNCSTCRLALKWLADQKYLYEFVDVRAEDFDTELIGRWIKIVGWETVLNRRGATWKNLSKNDRDGLSGENVEALVTRFPLLIKRPVFEIGDKVIVGFKDEEREELRATLQS